MYRHARLRLIAELAVPCSVAVVASPPREVLATVMIQRSIDELTHAADAVVVVTVRQGVSLWDHGRIVTDTTVDVDQTIHRTASFTSAASLVVRSPGGIVGDVGQRVAGAPVLIVGRRYVLFITHTPRGDYEVVGFSQGVLPVLGATVMPANVSAMEVIPSSGSGPASIVVPPSGIALAEFAQRVAIFANTR